MDTKFGPAGNSESFYAQGYKRTAEAPAWLHQMGLNAFEYSFGRGVSLSKETAELIADEAEKNSVQLSVHAPYFINLAVSDDERREKNFNYFFESAQAADFLRAKRLVFHPGAVTKMERDQALSLALPFFKEIISFLDDKGLENITLCPETMGKLNQLGDLHEVIEFCQVDDRIIPTIDFGHLHARGLGALNIKEDFAAVLDELENGIGHARTKIMHVHFSRIEYTKQGEKKHHTFADKEYGPDFDLLAELLAERELTPCIICESRGTMAEDALYMKNAYLAEMEKKCK